MPGVAVDMVGVPSHDLVRLRGRELGQTIYVDAWSNLPAFVVDPSLPADAPLLSDLGEPPPPVVPKAASRAPFPASSYEEGEGDYVVLLPERNAPTRPVSLKIRAPKLDRASLARVKDPWRIYLYARILHIYDDPRASDLYQLVIERECTGQPGPKNFLCTTSTLLLERTPPAAQGRGSSTMDN
jgi:hypothetical protein